jgi:hypothetical protein
VLAAVIALLLSAPLLLPLMRFSPNIAKYMDPEFRSVQPLQYFVLNLVINDIVYHRSELLGKFPYPYLYTLYIGWVPVLLAAYGITRIKRDSRTHIFRFLIAAIILAFLVASAILLKPLTEIFPALAGIRHPPQIAGLAIPLILALSAYGLEKLISLRWPDLFMYFEKTKSKQGLFSLRWILLIPLFFSLKSSYNFSQIWLYTTRRDPEIYRLLSTLKTDTIQWVEPPFGEHAFVEPAVAMGLKLSPGIMTWTWRDHAYPATFRYLSRAGKPQEPVVLKGKIDTFSLYEGPEVNYAEVYLGEERLPCKASGSGGTISVSCNTEKSGTLVLQEYTYPGWQVWMDGRKAPLIFDETWLKVQAPAGTHQYTFRFLPWDVPFGIALSLCGLIASVYLWRNPKKDFLDVDG